MATIVPDPVGSFTSAFQVADTASRDRARIALQERQMAENAVERAEQRKAENFNRMLRYISEGNRAAEIAADNRRLDAQLGISRYSAETSRMNALRERTSPRTQVDDPLGILGNRTTPQNRVTSFQGVDGGLVEIPQAPSEEFGSGIDANVSDRNNPALRALEADIELAQSGGLPESYATTPNSPLIEIPPPPEVMVEGTAVEEVPVAGPAPAVSAPVEIPTPVASAEPALLPPPVEVPSLADVDISASTRETLAGLERDSKAATRKAAIKQAEAQRFSRIKDPAYYGPTQQRQVEAVEAAAEAQTAASNAAQIKADLPNIKKRQEILSSLTDLDSVLPPQEKAELIRVASDPATGGQADRQLATLAAYSKVRNERGLTYRSNGIRTADMVARAGANLATDDARKEKQAADEVRIAQSGLAAITNPESEESKEEAKAYRKILRDNAAGAAAWQGRLDLFKKAVEADTAPELQMVDEGPIVPAQAAPTANPQTTPSYDIVSAINNAPRADLLRPVKDALGIANGNLTPEQIDQWSQSKATVERLAGGREGIIAAGAQGGQVTTLDDFKKVVRRAFASRVREMSATEQVQAGIGPGSLPRNARSYLDVADALAEDMWVRRDGRQPDSVAVPGTPAINPANRAKIEEIKNGIDLSVK